MKEIYTQHYETALEIPSHYIWKKKSTFIGKRLKDMHVIDEGCISLFTLSQNNRFALFYPFESEQQVIPFRIPRDEKPKAFDQDKSGEKLFAYASWTVALLYKSKVIKFFHVERREKAVSVNLSQEAMKVISKDQKFYVLLKNKKILVFSLLGKVLKNESAEMEIFECKKPELQSEGDIGAFGWDCADDVWIINEKDHRLEQYLKTKVYANKAEFDHTFISESEDTNWSKLKIDWELPEDTAVKIAVSIDGKEAQHFDSMPNMLLYDFVGTSLKVKLTLLSQGLHYHTPKVYALNAIVNEKLYSDYLPAYYQQDKEVLSRFLSIFQEVMNGFEEKIEKSAEMIDPLYCDESYLAWLSQLLGTNRDYRWETRRWRQFLAALPKLYRDLGTRQSMSDAIEIYCDEIPEIRDDFEDAPWTFCVYMSDKIVKNERNVEVIESIIEAFKPAHTTGKLSLAYDSEAFMLGQSSLTLNTKIK